MRRDFIRIENLNVDEFKHILRGVVREEFVRVNDGNSNFKDELLSRKEASIFLGISLPTLRSYVKRGIIIEKRLGSKVYYSKQDLMTSMVNTKKS